MKKYVYFSVPLYGHVIPTLRIVKELVNNEVEVVYYTTDEFASVIRDIGAEYKEYTCFNDKTYKKMNNLLYNFNTLLLDLEKLEMINVLVFKIARFVKDLIINEYHWSDIDCIMFDAGARWGAALVGQLKKVGICIHTSFAWCNRLIEKDQLHFMKYYLKLDPRKYEFSICNEIMDKYESIKSKYLPEYSDDTEHLNLVLMQKELHPYANCFEENYKFIGCAVDNRKDIMGSDFEENNEADIIYISMGSLHADEEEYMKFYQECFKAFYESSYKVIMNIGSRKKEEFGSIPENVKLYNYVPQTEVLKKSKLFITHGGMGSFQEGVYYGVPMLCVPYNDDQFLNAKIIKEIGLGDILDINSKSNDIMRLTDCIINTKEISTKCKYYMSLLRDNQNLKNIYSIISDYVDKEKNKTK